MYRSVVGNIKRGVTTWRRSSWQHRGCAVVHYKVFQRQLHQTTKCFAVKPFMLADIGEGITECQIMSWLVKPGDRVAQFDPICEVQSDKASVEITSRFDGTITKLHYDTDDIAIVGKPLVDIDMEASGEAEEPAQPSEPNRTDADNSSKEDVTARAETEQGEDIQNSTPVEATITTQPTTNGLGRALLSPAVRYQLKLLGIDPSCVHGTGKDGRISKDDVQRHVDEQSAKTSFPLSSPVASASHSGKDQPILLNAIEKQMFRTMTKSLAIPQFLYTHSVDFSSLNKLRQRANAIAQADKHAAEASPKLTPLPFIMKALSQVFLQFPKMNAHLDADTDPNRPQLTPRSSHNFGIAIDTPQGLVVPVVKNVQDHSVTSLAAEIKQLSERAQAGRLQPNDFTDATFLVSNIGSIGGNVVSPVIVSPMVGILGIGKAQTIPAFAADGSVIPRHEATLSWSADHRVLDGATVAKCAEAVTKAIENVDVMVTKLR